MNKYLKETIEQNTIELRGGEFIDAYNRAIRRDGLAGTIYAGVNSKSQIFVVVKNDCNRWDAETSKYKE